MIRPMLCRLAARPHDDPGWVWERKYDGVRMLVITGPDGSVRLQARSGTDKTPQFPELADGVGVGAPLDSVLDGEVVGSRGLTFQEFAQRRVNRTDGIAAMAAECPAFFAAFDAIRLDGVDWSMMPLRWRRDLLKKHVGGQQVVFPTESGSGTAMFECAKENGWEGVVGKDLSQPYLFGKRAWLKVKVWQEGVFMLCDPVPGLGRRDGMAGSFALMDLCGKYVGHVGTGFDEAELRRLTVLVRTGDSPVYAKVKYVEMTNDGKLRFPVYLRQIGRDGLAPNEAATCQLSPRPYCPFVECQHHTQSSLKQAPDGPPQAPR